LNFYNIEAVLGQLAAISNDTARDHETISRRRVGQFPDCSRDSLPSFWASEFIEGVEQEDAITRVEFIFEEVIWKITKDVDGFQVVSQRI